MRSAMPRCAFPDGAALLGPTERAHHLLKSAHGLGPSEMGMTKTLKLRKAPDQCLKLDQSNPKRHPQNLKYQLLERLSQKKHLKHEGNRSQVLYLQKFLVPYTITFGYLDSMAPWVILHGKPSCIVRRC